MNASSLYARLLGASWQQLAEPVRFIHSTEATVRAHGRLRIAHGRGWFVRFLAWLLRLPRVSEASDTRLVITRRADEEQWSRTFDDRRLDTRQYAVGEHELAERIGVLEFRFRLEALERSLLFRQIDAGLLLGSFRLKVPSAWAPAIEAREDPAGARQIRVRVSLALAALGPLLTYDGTIEIEDPCT